jgi:outer membrane biogenesis lipoprotein LolB
MSRRIFLIAILGFALSACAGSPAMKREAVAARPFSIEGRFSLQHKEDRWMGAIAWDYAPRVERVTLEVAGQTLAAFERVDETVTATLANGQTLEERGWRAVTSRATGVSLPLEAAAFWVRGAPSPNEPTQQIGPDTFTQLDWNVSVLSRDDRQRPQRVRWQNATTALILVLDVWHLD